MNPCQTCRVYILLWNGNLWNMPFLLLSKLILFKAVSRVARVAESLSYLDRLPRTYEAIHTGAWTLRCEMKWGRAAIASDSSVVACGFEDYKSPIPVTDLLQPPHLKVSFWINFTQMATFRKCKCVVWCWSLSVLLIKLVGSSLLDDILDH